MKKLVFAFACLAIGIGAFATTKPAVKASTQKQQDSKFRIQKSFSMWDACGQQITVWVSAPNGTDWDVMYQVAIDHVIDCLNSSGCYQK
ncbi:hypothetical protein ACWKWU_02560 [Chitinophaga lutea]